MRRVLAAALLLSLAAVGLPADDEGTILVRIESKDAGVREAAKAEWKALDEATRFALARRALDDPNAPGAWAAANRVSAFRLNLDEQSRQAKALLRGPDTRFPSLPSSFGAADLIPMWRVSGEDAQWYEASHRIATSDQLPEMIAYARRAPGFQWARMVWLVHLVAAHSDDHRDVVAGFLHEDLRLLEDISPERPRRDGTGLPEHFETIARAAWGLERYVRASSILANVAPMSWLLRWAGEIEPTHADLPFLDELIEDAEYDDPRSWALRHRVRLSGDDAVPWLRSLLGDEGPDCELEIAAHLAILGDRSEWDRRAKANPDAAKECPLLWRVDRDAARSSAAWYGLDVGRHDRARLAAVWGVRITEEDLAAVQARIENLKPGPDIEEAEVTDRLLWWYREVRPDGLRGPAIRSLGRRLARMESGASIDPKDDRAVLGLLEVRDRGALVHVLRAWSRADEELRALAVPALVELGEQVDPDLCWMTWDEGRIDVWSWMGRVPDAAVRAELRERVLAAGDDAGYALGALCRAHGMARRSAEMLSWAVLWDRPLLETCLADLDAGRLVALLDRARARAGSERPNLVFGLPDDRLRAIRASREGDGYWIATRALAERGDPEASAEMARALRENRTPMLEWVLNRDRDPTLGRRFARLHAARLAHNCCARFHASFLLRYAFPTIQVKDAWTFVPQREIALAWLDANEHRLQFSEVANGWVPR